MLRLSHGFQMGNGGDDVVRFADGTDVGDGHRAAAVCFAQLATPRVVLQIMQNAAESRRLVVGGIVGRNEKERHFALF